MIETLKRIVVTARPGASRSALLVAIGVSLILVSFILIISTRSGPAQRSALDDIDPADVPSITDSPVQSAGTIDAPSISDETTDAHIRLKDRDDPTKTAWDVEFAKLKPIRDTDKVEIEEPRAWYLLGNSNLVFIRSDRAEFIMTDMTSEPSSGRFTGNVEVLQFERRDDGSLPEPVASGSSVRITTNWLDFDAVGSELATSENVLISSESIDADCEGLRIVFNEVDERIELLEVPGTLLATVRTDKPTDVEPQEDPGTQGTPETRRTQANSGQASEQPVAEPAGPEQFYAVTFEGSVHVEQPVRRIDADRARVWIRLVDNEIPDGNLSRAITPKLPDPVGLHAILTSLAVASSQPELPTSRDMELYDDVQFRCVGPTVVRPMSERPAALGSGDDIVLRFESEPENTVAFSDDVLKAKGNSSAIEYGFTNKILALTGYDGHPTTIDVEDSGSIMGESLTIGLATGVGQAMGAGVLTEAGTGRSLTWTEQADVVFRTDDGWITGSLEQAIASGSIELKDTDATIKADSINTRFAQGDETLLERAVLTGTVDAKTADGSLSADRLDVRFDVSTGESVPQTVTASGSVRGEQDDAVITAELLEADLDNDKDGNPKVTIARASDNVRFDREDGAFAEGDRLRADLDREHVEVQGAPALVGANSAQIAARSITLDGSSRSIDVPGAGEFTLLSEDGNTQIAHATWTDSMAYTDASGELEAVGQVVAVSTPDELSRDTLTGDSLFALVMPADGSAAIDDRSDRQLISATITSAEENGASVEVLRLMSADDETPARITRLDSTRIDIDNIGGILTVPAAGRLLVSDQRLEADASDQSTLRGSALFDWEGDLLLDRPSGVMNMSNRVRMIHRPTGDGADVELECESLMAEFSEENAGSELTSAGDSSQLEDVEASGAVWARTGQQQILADKLVYVAETQAATASAAGGGWVTLFDPAQPAPVTAAELLWSLKSGRIEVIRPNPVSIPR